MAGHAGYDYVHYWMGHSLKQGQDESYFHDDPEEHRKQYKEKALPHLRLTRRSATETDQTIETMQERLNQQQNWLYEVSGFLLKKEDLTDEEKERIRKIYEEMRVAGYSKT